MARSPREINQEILAALDVVAEYRDLGVEIVGQPRASGMVACRAWGREDRRPSAWVNARSGFYGDSGGDGQAAYHLSLFDFAAKAGKFADWKEARKAYAAKAGVKIGRGAGSQGDGKHWKDRIELQSWETPGNDVLALRWCLQHKKGVTVEAIKAAGGCLAYYPCYRDKESKELKRTINHRQVIAIPCYGEWLLDADPVAWVCWDITGADFDVSPKDHPPSEPRLTAKMVSVGPTRGTLLGLSEIMLLCDPDRRQLVELAWKVEGPADMLALWAAIPADQREQHVVITNGGGATADVLPHQAKLLAGLNAAICGDCDQAGQVGAAKWLRALHGLTTESRNVVLPWPIKPSHGGDIRDYLTGRTIAGEQPQEMPLKSPERPYGALQTIYAESSPYQPPEAASGDARGLTSDSGGSADGVTGNAQNISDAAIDRFTDDQIAQALEIDVLGRTPDGSIKVYSSCRKWTVLVSNVARLKYEDLLNNFGTPVRKVVSRTNEDSAPGMYPIRDVREALAHLASFRMIGDETELGIGCWPLREPGEEGAGDPDAEKTADLAGVVLVNATEAAAFNGDFRRITHPRHGGHLLAFETGVRPWFDFNRLSAALRAAESQEFRTQIAGDLLGLWGRWRWRAKPDSMIATALTFATWVQTLWEWRPRIDVLGASNTGKSMLCACLQGIFRDCCVMTSDTTAAGLRQKIANRAIAVVVDEVDAKNRTKLARQREILEMIRSASRGTAAIRGTGTQHAVEFTLRHLVWVAGITLSYDDQADRNRAVLLNLLPPLPEMAGKLVLPPAGELADLGQRALAVALWSVREARKRAVRLKDQRVPGADPRLVESYAVPAAMLSTILGNGDQVAAEMLSEMLETAKQDIPTESDETDLIQDILQAIIRMDRYQLTVGQAIRHVTNSAADNRDDWKMALEQRGVKIGWFGWDKSNVSRPIPDGWATKAALILNYKMIRNALLRGTRWEGQSIDQVIRRLPGCIASIRRVGGNYGRVAILPLDDFVATYVGAEDEPQQKAF